MHIDSKYTICYCAYLFEVILSIFWGVIITFDNSFNSGYSSIIIAFISLYFILFSVSFILDHNKNLTNKDYNNNADIMLKQFPVSAKDIFIVRFIIMQLILLPILILELFLIVLYLTSGVSKIISIYFGTTVIIFCIINLLFSFITGFSILSQKTNNKIKYIKPLIMFVFSIFYFIFAIRKFEIVFKLSGLYKSAFFQWVSGSFGRVFSQFSGFLGVGLIIITLILSYYIGCILPLKLSER